MVFYRKYRPQKIADLDLVSVRSRLESILKQKEIPHAFLFTGPKGLGKTSTARILAKAINCIDKKGVEPCNACEVCRSITNGSNLDVMEIDAASNRGIDEIRELRERIKYAPAALLKKIYIIDEVHMLTTDAFNALLKTLEEPPSHAIFILATTEEEKVPATILSRAFHLVFKKPTKEEAISSLQRIVEGEKLAVEDGVLASVLDYSEGSFRDASKVMEELTIASDSGKITKDLLNSIYSADGIDNAVRDILIALSNKDAKMALEKIREISAKGTDFKIVTEKIAARLHSIILLRNGFEKEAEDIKSFEMPEITRLLSSVNASYRDIKTSVLPELPLEIVVMEFCFEDKNDSAAKPENVLEHDNHIEKKEDALQESNKIEALKVDNIKEEKEVAVVEETEENPAIGKTGYGMFAQNAMPEHFVHAFLSAVKQDNHSIAGILRGCKLVNLGETEVEFEAKYKFHRDKLNEPKTIKVLDKRASELLNRQVHVKVEIASN